MDTQAAVEPKVTPGISTPPSLVRGLSYRDAVLLIIGGVVASAIFLTPSDVAAALPSPIWFFFAWIAGGVVSLMAGLAFGELGAMFPEAGGQYVYLREAFGDFFAFQYGWMMFVAGASGGIASIAVGSARFLGKAIPFLASDHVLFTMPGITLHFTSRPWHFTTGDLIASSSILLLTWLNVRGLRPAVMFQNASTWLKYGAFAALLVFGFAIGKGSWSHFAANDWTAPFHGATFYPFMSALGVAFIAVFWTYDGWVYVSWVAGEIKEPERSIPRSLVLGIVIVMALYLAMCAVYVYALPLSQIAKEGTLAEAAATQLFSPAIGVWLSLLIALSALGGTSVCILGGARVSYAMGRDALFFRSMGDVHPRYRTPHIALVAQGVWSAAIALTGTYDQLFTYTMFGMVLSYVACVIALFVLRRKRPDLARPYRCFGYPWLPGLYVVLIGGWIINTVVERPSEALSCIVLMAVGVPGYLYWKRRAA
ncbi:MAG TPA: amino acid permease [Terriglobales bacterium]|nr:amino acid permease [Terriglobales bacterium]